MTEEDFAQSIREVAGWLKKAEIEVAKTDANLSKVVAQAMLKAELDGVKTAVAQSRAADMDDAVYEARVAHGVAKGNLAAVKAEFKAREIAFEHWRTKQASLRLERKAYNY